MDYFSPFLPWYDFVIVDDSCLSTVGNNGPEFSVSENTILCEIGDVSATETCNVPALDSRSSCN